MSLVYTYETIKWTSKIEKVNNKRQIVILDTFLNCKVNNNYCGHFNALVCFGYAYRHLKKRQQAAAGMKDGGVVISPHGKSADHTLQTPSSVTATKQNSFPRQCLSQEDYVHYIQECRKEMAKDRPNKVHLKKILQVCIPKNNSEIPKEVTQVAFCLVDNRIYQNMLQKFQLNFISSCFCCMQMI